MAGHVFISYSHADRAYVDRLATYLHAAAIPTWYDVDIETGEAFSRKIQQAIDKCFAFVVVLSPSSVASEWVLRELSRSVRKDKPQCPLLRVQCDLPIELDGVQQENVTDGRMPGPRFVARLRDLSRTTVFAKGGPGGAAQHVDLRRLEVLHSGPGVDPEFYQVLRGSFLEVVPRTPHLFECRDVRVSRGAPHRRTRRKHIVHVVTYVGEGDGPTLPIDSGEFRAWLEVVEEQPVLLLYGQPQRSGKLRLRMSCLHEWLVRCAAREPNWTCVSSLPLAIFRSVGSYGAVFHRTAIEEVDRVTGSENGVWRTLKDEGLVPVDEMTLLELMELVRFLEVPLPVFKRLAALGSPTELVVDCIRRNQSSHDPFIDSWLTSVRERSRHEPAGLGRRQFRSFIRFLERRGRGVRLPRYSSQNAGYWRVFTAMYPDVLKGIAHVIRTSTSGNDVAFAASLLSTLTLANDRVVSSKAGAVLRELPARRQDFPQYYVRREILRSLAEGGERTWLPRAIGLVATEGATGEERRYLNAYGWTADLVEAKIERRLVAPTLRDQQMREHLEVMGDVTRQQRAVRGRAY